MIKIAIASCSRMQLVSDQVGWAEIAAEQPDALLLVGDNIYLERNGIGLTAATTAAGIREDAKKLTKDLRKRYEDQFAEPNFQALMKQLGLLDANGDRKSDEALKAHPSRVFPIYDDHDFIGNDRYGGDRGNDALRQAARAAFIEAFGRRNWAGISLFSITRAFGGLVDIFILDGRYYRKSKDSAPNDETSMLGREWAWFEKGLSAPQPQPAPYTIVISGTTVQTYLTEQESWHDYPDAYKRLKRDIGGRSGTLVVSGDIHANRHSVKDGIVEVVSSGIATRKGNVQTGAELRNYGVLTFTEQELRVSLRGKDVPDHDYAMSLADWGTEQPLSADPVDDAPADPPDVIDVRDPAGVPVKP